MSSELLATQDDPHAAFDQEINDVQAAYTKLSEEFMATLQQLRIERNELAPIPRLPNEILQDIFRRSTGCGRDHRSNFAITSTCSRWRSAALGDSMLWSWIELNSERDVRLATLFLERTREQSLAVLLGDLPYTHEPLVGQLLMRARSLSASAPPTKPTPHLEELTLRRPNRQTAVYGKISNFPLASLRELTLQNCCLDLKPGNYVGLRRLEIAAPFPSGYNHTDLLVTFRDSPSLEVLSLVFTTSSTYRGVLNARLAIVSPPRKIRMNSLRSLKLSMLAVELVNVLSAIDFSATGQFVDIFIDLDPCSTPTELEKVSIHSLFSPRCLPIALMQNAYSLSSGHSDSTHLTLVGECLYGAIRRKHTLTIAWPDNIYGNGEIINAFVAHSPLASVTSLMTSTPDGVLPGKYGLILARCPSITHLSVQSSTGGTLYACLELFCSSVLHMAISSGYVLPLVNIRFVSRDSTLPVPVEASLIDPPSCFWNVGITQTCGELLRGMCGRWMGVQVFFDRLSSTLQHIEFNSFPLDTSGSDRAPLEHMKLLVTTIRRIRRGLRVTATGLYSFDGSVSDHAMRPCYPRDVWPAGEPFTWICNMEASHGSTEYCKGCGWMPTVVPPSLEAATDRTGR